MIAVQQFLDRREVTSKLANNSYFKITLKPQDLDNIEKGK